MSRKVFEDVLIWEKNKTDPVVLFINYFLTFCYTLSITVTDF